MTNESQFFTAVLTDMGAPVTPTSLSVLEAWSRGEKPAGNWSQWWNPLNTTQPAAGASNVNSVGVKAYPSAAAGEQATAQTITNSDYPALANALKTGAPLSAFQSSRVVSEVENTWGTKLYGSLVKSPNKAQPTPAAAPSSSSSGSGGIDLNPLDWAAAGAGAIGQATGKVAGATLGGVFVGVLDALGGLISGLATSASGAIVPIGTALVITLILVGPRQSKQAISTVVNLASPSPEPAPAPSPAAAAPSPAPDAPAELLDDEDAAYYQAQLRQWKSEQRAQARPRSGDYSFAGGRGLRGGAVASKTASAAGDVGDVAGAAALA